MIGWFRLQSVCKFADLLQIVTTDALQTFCRYSADILQTFCRHSADDLHIVCRSAGTSVADLQQTINRSAHSVPDALSKSLGINTLIHSWMDMSISKLTTAFQSGGWVPETSRRFHYWQPTPRWRPPPWLATPGNPAMSPRAEWEKTSTHHTHKTVERKDGQGRGDSLQGVSMLRKTLMLRKHWQKCQLNRYNALWTKNIRNPGAPTYITNRWLCG